MVLKGKDEISKKYLAFADKQRKSIITLNHLRWPKSYDVLLIICSLKTVNLIVKNLFEIED